MNWIDIYAIPQIKKLIKKNHIFVILIDYKSMIDYEQELYQQFSQEADRKRLDSDRLLEEASTVVRKCKVAADTLEQATSLKRIQLNTLELFSKKQKCWFENYKVVGIYLERGGENEVYYNPFTNSVFKLNDFAFAGDDAFRFFDRIKIHNQLLMRIRSRNILLQPKWLNFHNRRSTTCGEEIEFPSCL